MVFKRWLLTSDPPWTVGHTILVYFDKEANVHEKYMGNKKKVASVLKLVGKKTNGIKIQMYFLSSKYEGLVYFMWLENPFKRVFYLW